MTAQWPTHQGPLANNLQAWMLRLHLQTARKQSSCQCQAVSIYKLHRQTQGTLAAMGMHYPQHTAHQHQLVASPMRTLPLHQRPVQLHRQHLDQRRLTLCRPSCTRSAARTKSCSSRCGNE